ncbi:peptide chain release factor 1 [Blattabacterium cuenoti]|uniref:peptide chain release factor 1 n=1 Tax=Blattabacterium cuenoti TaxID=1653831 RepID=UPI00163C2536|nr:peptide chain release factor 1 [Blattabacterium cuenoti]
MKKTLFIHKLEYFQKQFFEISKNIENYNFSYQNQKKYRLFFKKYVELDKIIHLYKKYNQKIMLFQEAIHISENDTDEDMRQLAISEIKKILHQINYIETKYSNIFFSKKDKEYNEKLEDQRNVILELRSGTGGNEACLFVEDILRMYMMYFKKLNWKYNIIHAKKGNVKGYKEIILEVIGSQNVYGNLKFESGVHRVQRIPETESQGRIHTSAITVAVLPKVKKIEVNINFNDIKKETFRSSGAGGQHVNKTESAVRLTHIPSKTSVECQEGRSQHKNFEKAMDILRSRIYHYKMKKVLKKRSIKRKSLVSTGDRSVKIRTYNYPKNRVTDHRIQKSIFDLIGFMNGNIQKMINFIKKIESEN